MGLKDKRQTLVTKVVDHVRELADIGGLSDTSYVVPILNFVRRGCEVPAADFERMLRAADLDFLIASAVSSAKAAAASASAAAAGASAGGGGSTGGGGGGSGGGSSGWGTEANRHRRGGTGLQSGKGSSTTGGGSSVARAGASDRVGSGRSRGTAAGAGVGRAVTPSRDRQIDGVRGEGGKALDFEC
jgi:hypothetical protein